MPSHHIHHQLRSDAHSRSRQHLANTAGSNTTPMYTPNSNVAVVSTGHPCAVSDVSIPNLTEEVLVGGIDHLYTCYFCVCSSDVEQVQLTKLTKIVMITQLQRKISLRHIRKGMEIVFLFFTLVGKLVSRCNPNGA